jgi:hypothetical protein
VSNLAVILDGKRNVIKKKKKKKRRRRRRRNKN